MQAGSPAALHWPAAASRPCCVEEDRARLQSCAIEAHPATCTVPADSVPVFCVLGGRTTLPASNG